MNSKRAAAAFALLLIGFTALADADALPRFVKVIYDIPYGDKVGHFILLGAMSYLLVRAVLSSYKGERRWRAVFFSLLILAALAGAEEFSQRWLANRMFDLWDLFAGYAGAALGAWFVARPIKK
ncbi:MAG: hypothetical protein Fur002_23000 [Anaerolineales bacterium]